MLHTKPKLLPSPFPPDINGAGQLLCFLQAPFSRPWQGVQQDLGRCPSLWGRDGAKTASEGGQEEKLAIMVRLKTPQTKETNPNCMMMAVTIIMDVLVTAVNKNNSGNKIAMMLAIVPMLMIIIRLFINCEPLSALAGASASQTRPKLQPCHINAK